MMVFYKRDLEKTLKRFAKFPVVAILGPRQSGKTTLARHTFAKHAFLDLDDLELRALAQHDPQGFLRKYDNNHGIIIDEFQNAPELLSYIKVIVDSHDRPGYFVLTGSQNFLVNEKISQSLAGRVGILTLLPLSLHEFAQNKLLKKDHPEEIIFHGCYPRLYSSSFTPEELYPSYTQTYLERDVRQIINVVNLGTFKKFMKLCAARVGQLLNYTDLAVNCGISVPTVQQWLSVLEASYIIFLLRPHWTNFNKRVTKTPKIYFYDTGLACSLLEIDSPKTLLLNPYYGNLFESFIVSDLFKQFFNAGAPVPLYFWRDKNGELEVDCLVERAAVFTAIEIKSSETFRPELFDSLNKWSDFTQQLPANSYLVYAGTKSLASDRGHLVSWLQVGTLVQKIKR
jgi:predicted AAA+ superfamily ATPase